MKKILALVIALALVLCSVCAMAADSKTNSDITTVETETEKKPEKTTTEEAPALVIEVVEELPVAIETLKETFVAASDAGDVLAALPEEVKAELPEIVTKINEFVAVKVDGYIDEMGKVTASFTFETLYTEGQTVIGAFFVDGEWILVEGKVNADGSVSFTFDPEQAASLNGKVVALAVISD